MKRIAATAVVVLAAVAAGASQLATASIAFTVDTTADTVDANPGDGTCADASGHCSLRAAIQEADRASTSVRITVPAGTYQLTIRPPSAPFGTIPPSAFDPQYGDLDVSGSVQIVGASAAQTIVNAAGIDRVFQIASGAQVTLQGLTIEGGQSTYDCDGGWGVLNAGSLQLTADVVTNNVSSCGYGGGVYNTGSLGATDTTFSHNVVYQGGGLYNAAGASATIDTSTFEHNGGNYGGGGGVDNLGTLTLTNVTLSANSASTANGGAIEASGGSATIRSSTIASNTASGSGGGGGIRFAGGSAWVLDTILAGNGGGNCSGGAPTSGGYNIDDGTTCGLSVVGDQTSTNPLLGSLGANGGPVDTMALLASSPAIDAGARCQAATDARGISRPQGAGCDIGAYEATPVASASGSSLSASPASVAADDATTSTITVTLRTSTGGPGVYKYVTLTQGSGGSTVTGSPALTDTSGVATFTVTDATAQTVVYTAKDTTDGGTVLSQTASVAFGASSGTGGSTASAPAAQPAVRVVGVQQVPAGQTASEPIDVYDTGGALTGPLTLSITVPEGRAKVASVGGGWSCPTVTDVLVVCSSNSTIQPGHVVPAATLSL